MFASMPPSFVATDSTEQEQSQSEQQSHGNGTKDSQHCTSQNIGEEVGEEINPGESNQGS